MSSLGCITVNTQSMWFQYDIAATMVTETGKVHDSYCTVTQTVEVLNGFSYSWLSA